jgi:hypothetical protein
VWVSKSRRSTRSRGRYQAGGEALASGRTVASGPLIPRPLGLGTGTTFNGELYIRIEALDRTDDLTADLIAVASASALSK